MLRDEKWIEYAIAVLKSVSGGSHSIIQIAGDVDGSESYIAKVIASLRKAGFINAKYELAKPLSQITIREVIEAKEPIKADSPVMGKITSIMMDALDQPITIL